MLRDDLRTVARDLAPPAPAVGAALAELDAAETAGGHAVHLARRNLARALAPRAPDALRAPSRRRTPTRSPTRTSPSRA